jgi:sigma-B regulation protein RsbU (phosphoserine phosphatase)
MDTGEMTYCNAGHNPPFLVRAGHEVIELNAAHGLPLGSMPDQEYRQGSYTFSIGDAIVLYTDGITEAVNNENKLYGEKRLKILIGGQNAHEPGALVEMILEDVNLFAEGAEQADDITLFNLKYY